MGDQAMINEKGKPKALVILAEGAEEMEVVITVDVLRRGGIDVTLAGYYDSKTGIQNENLPSNDKLNILPITCSREVRILPDKTLDEALKCRANSSSESINDQCNSNSTNTIPYDIIILPGGMQGAKTLAASMKIGQLLKRQEAEAFGKSLSEDSISPVIKETQTTTPNVINKKYLAAICAGPLAFLSHGIGKGHKITSHPSIKDRFTSNPDMYTYIDDQDVVIDGPYITSRGPGTTFAFALSIVAELQSKKVADSIVQPMMIKNYN